MNLFQRILYKMKRDHRGGKKTIMKVHCYHFNIMKKSIKLLNKNK